MLGGVVRGRRATLRVTTETDLADHVAWHADFETTKWLPRRPWPHSLEQRGEWLKETAKDRTLIHWELEASGAHVGYCAARLEWAPMSESWSVDSLFLAPAARELELGEDVMAALHRYLVDYLGLAYGEMWLYRDDPFGRRLAESVGYTEFAHGRDVFYREGRYWDDWRGLLRADVFRERFPAGVEYPAGAAAPPARESA
jgi:L-amino acid N-acyltransferase YncA